MPSQSEPHIVGIGASAGGVKALQEFFEALPGQVGAAFVVIMHLDPDANSEMSAILSAKTSMPVTQVEKAARLEANHVYVIAPNRQLRIKDLHISAPPFDRPRGQRMPIDMFFRSLADQHVDALAIVLTGAGADGSIGVRAIKEVGGIVLVQDPEEAEYSSMPRSAIATEVADAVLPVRAIADRVVELLSSRKSVKQGMERAQEDNLQKVLAHVRGRTGHDFSHYKRATILRRISRRVQLTRQKSLTDYLKYLKHSPEEAQALFGDFLISVTTFFRDPEAFAVLAERVIPTFFENRGADQSIRVWVPGCASGEEAYSLAILLMEEASRRESSPEIQLFASDLDAGALAIAREGRYPAGISNDLTDERLSRFFVREGDYFRVRGELRELVLFAGHSLLKDPPFSKLDLISCRNLLIYLNSDLQSQACSVFHYGLNPNGHLFLGSSESADQPGGLFRVLDRDARIFQAVAHTAHKRPVLPALFAAHRGSKESIPSMSRSVSSGPTSNDAALHRQMLEKIAPPSILVDSGHRAIHISESSGRFLQPSAGTITTDVVDLVRQELRFDLRSALHRAFERGEATLSGATGLQLEGKSRRVYLQVKPVSTENEGTLHALIMFVEGEGHNLDGGTSAVSNDHPTDQSVIQTLREELQLSQAQLRSMREDSETVNEELRAANEELQSINEEYRSTSEELETSKEELQSINEELQTVNAELKIKLESISRAHSDLQNFMAATDFGTLFLDPDLRIKRFTPRLADLFNVTESDEGRPITDFTHGLQFDDMAEQARAVLKDLIPIEREIPGRNGGWYLVRMRPYRTVEDKIDGVVATFVDIGERRRVEEALRQSEESLGQEMRLVELSRAPIFVWDFDNGILQWNRGSEQLYGYSREEAIGQRKNDLLRSVVPGSSFELLKLSLLEKGSWSGELRHSTKDGRELTVESHIELVVFEGRRLVLESTRDITDLHRWQERQQMLLAELTHRVKNTLTVVQSMARQTLRNTHSAEEFVARFEGRLSALANAHKLLVESEWEGAELGALARTQLQAHSSGGAARLKIEGPPITLPSALATSFGLVLHELATNATKYGALSVDNGHVELSWSVISRNDDATLRVEWRELDGPVVHAPQKQGFGSVLIEKGLPEASVELTYQPEGVKCIIEMSLQDLNSNVAEIHAAKK